MIAGLTGALLSHGALERADAAWWNPSARARDHTGLRTWHRGIRDRLGPSSSARSVFDRIADPLVRWLGFDVLPFPARKGETIDAVLTVEGVPVLAMVVSAWGIDLSASWRRAVHCGLAHGVRWSIAINGPSLRVLDLQRLYARRYAEFDLAAALEDTRAVQLLVALLGAPDDPRGAALGVERAVAASEAQRRAVGGSLRQGVQEALVEMLGAFRAAGPRRAGARQIFDETLIVIYRILFLLFAEARSLVPAWHPIYREAYTLERLMADEERNREFTGLWEGVQAISRLAHRGCRAGALRVPPFNGRLFSPVYAPLADTLPLSDALVSRALLALTTRTDDGVRERISYADLGVEQLGSVYEHLLDLDVAPAARTAPVVLIRTGRRKATGTFYTPRSLTEFLVRRTLAPLVEGAPAERILRLRVLDPAMGSGAFLVAACRYLAVAYEEALLREEAAFPGDVGEDDRAAFRRAVAQRCLFGVDANPMAVQLGRLSLWLATLAVGKPLSFLDHHLRPGNSLVGASVDDILREPAPGATGRRRERLPLFPVEALHASVEAMVRVRLELAETPDDTVEQVRGKERALAALEETGGPLERWKRAADLWCAAWFRKAASRSTRGGFAALLDRALGGAGPLPARVADPLLAEADSLAAAHRFFHWPLEFPELFYAQNGQPAEDAGFDVVVGNPPWEMLKGSDADGRKEIEAFARGSGQYLLQSGGHANLYHLFVERMLRLVKRTGRIGMLLPAGFAADESCAQLRRRVLDGARVDTFTLLDNRDGLFPIHRGLRFLLLTLTNGGSTQTLPVHPGIRSADVLDRMPDAGEAAPVRISTALLDRLGGPGKAIPDLRTDTDVEIAALLSARFPSSASPDGWHVHFGRELNATDDRPHFVRGGLRGLPVVEGKHIFPFTVDPHAATYRLPLRTASRLLDAESTYRRRRLGYREVASATNRQTLIAAVLPRGVVTTHTVFCVKEALDDTDQEFLCGVFNSCVANYLVRMWVGTHVTAAVVRRLPIPFGVRGSPAYRRVAALSAGLAQGPDRAALAELNAAVAVLYGLTRRQFAHILSTFPLVPRSERDAALERFAEDGIISSPCNPTTAG